MVTVTVTVTDVTVTVTAMLQSQLQMFVVVNVIVWTKVFSVRTNLSLGHSTLSLEHSVPSDDQTAQFNCTFVTVTVTVLQL